MTAPDYDALRTDPPRLIRYLRELLGLSQEKFAHTVDCAVRSVVRWERGDTKPRPKFWRRILGLYDTTILKEHQRRHLHNRTNQ